MRLNLLMSFVYCRDYLIEIFVACAVEGQVSRGDERYLFNTFRLRNLYHVLMKLISIDLLPRTVRK